MESAVRVGRPVQVRRKPRREVRYRLGPSLPPRVPQVWPGRRPRRVGAEVADLVGEPPRASLEAQVRPAGLSARNTPTGRRSSAPHTARGTPRGSPHRDRDRGRPRTRTASAGPAGPRAHRPGTDRSPDPSRRSTPRRSPWPLRWQVTEPPAMGSQRDLPNRQIRRLVLYVHPVRLSAVGAAQVRCRIQPDRLSPVWWWLWTDTETDTRSSRVLSSTAQQPLANVTAVGGNLASSHRDSRGQIRPGTIRRRLGR